MHRSSGGRKIETKTLKKRCQNVVVATFTLDRRPGLQMRWVLLHWHKTGTHEGACSRSTLLQDAPRAKLPRLHQGFLAKKYVAQLLLPSFAPSYQTGLIWGSKLQEQICCTSLFQEQAPSSVLKFCLPWHDVSPVDQSNWLILLVPMPQSGCLIIQLLRRVLRVYGFGYLLGSVFRSTLPRVYRPLSSSYVYGANKAHTCEFTRASCNSTCT